MKSKKHFSKGERLCDTLTIVVAWLIALALLYLVIAKLRLL